MDVKAKRRKSVGIFTLGLLLSTGESLAITDRLNVDVKASAIHVDNIFRVIDDLKVSDNYLQLVPNINYSFGTTKQNLYLEYKGDLAKFSEIESADFNDQALKVVLTNSHTSRFESNFEVYYEKEHENPASFNRIDLELKEFNKYKRKYLSAGISYGQKNSIGRLLINIQRVGKEYKKPELNYLNYNSDQISSRFNYRFSPKTLIYIKGMLMDFDYESVNIQDLDNQYQRYELGGEWDITEKVNIDAGAGYQIRNYDSENIRDIDGLAYNAKVEWKINTYTKLLLTANREALDSSLEESSGLLRTSIQSQLDHDITERTKLNIGFGYMKDDIASVQNRKDERKIVNLEFRYELARNLATSIEYVFEERISSELIAEFKSNTVGINLYYFLGE